jgi:xanthine dehydrogenase accessory factor
MNIWSFIEDKLSKENSLYLMIVVDSKGSSPGKTGFSMAVSSDDELFGSIGGGTMEFKLVENCKELLRKNDHNIFLKKQVHNGSAEDSSGLMCSGEQTVAFIPFSATDMQLIQQITNCLNNSKTGILNLTQDQCSFTVSEDNQESQFFFSGIQNDWIFREVIGFKNNI